MIKTEFESLAPPKLFSESRMIIGMFGFYNPSIPYYELWIPPLLKLLKKYHTLRDMEAWAKALAIEDNISGKKVIKIKIIFSLSEL